MTGAEYAALPSTYTATGSPMLLALTYPAARNATVVSPSERRQTNRETSTDATTTVIAARPDTTSSGEISSRVSALASTVKSSAGDAA